MLTLQWAFGQLRMIVNTAAESTTRFCPPSSCSSQFSCKETGPGHLLTETSAVRSVSTSVGWHSQQEDGKDSKVHNYDAPSPYRNPGPSRYGYSPKYYTGGLLPRGEKLGPIKTMKKYKPTDRWDRKHALFGQNDYIDLLSDGSLTPQDLLVGPDWLRGFKGNELQRLSRRLKFEGERLKVLYPSQYHDIRKRIDFLNKKYNVKRGKRVGGG